MPIHYTDKWGRRRQLDWWSLVGGALSMAVLVFGAILPPAYALFLFPIERGQLGAVPIGAFGFCGGIAIALMTFLWILPELLLHWRGDPAPLPRRPPLSDMARRLLFLFMGLCLAVSAVSVPVILVGLVARG